MIHRLIDLFFELLARFWLPALVLCSLALLVTVSLLLRPKSPPTSSRKRASRRERADGLMGSLRRLPKERYKCLHHVFVPRLDDKGTTHLPHVVISQFGIFVIQNQNQAGRIVGGRNDSEWSVYGEGRSHAFINPIIRNDYHIKALALHLDLPAALFSSIILFPENVKFTQEQPSFVLKGELGRHILAHHAEIVSPEIIDHVTAKLEPLVQQHYLETARRKHESSKSGRLRHAEEHAL